MEAQPGITWSPHLAQAWQNRIDCLYFLGDGAACRTARLLDEHPWGWPSDHVVVLAALELPTPSGAP